MKKYHKSAWDEEVWASIARAHKVTKNNKNKSTLTISQDRLISTLYQTGNFTIARLAKMYKRNPREVQDIINQTSKDF